MRLAACVAILGDPSELGDGVACLRSERDAVGGSDELRTGPHGDSQSAFSESRSEPESPHRS